MPNYQFRMDVRIDDPQALYNAAFERALKDGETVQGAMDVLGTPDCIEPDACLVMLLDPGSLAGCSVHQSAAEEYGV